MNDRNYIRGIQLNSKTESNMKCGSIDEIRNLIINVKDINQSKVIESMVELKTTKMFSNSMEEFEIYHINDNYSIEKNEFKLTVLPKLLKLNNNNPKKQSSALLLLAKILFDGWKVDKKAKLTLIAINSSLIPDLIETFENNNDSEIQQSIYRLYALLFFVIAKDNKEVRKLILKCDSLLISIIRNLNETNDLCLIKDALLLLQFFSIWCKEYETISPMLSSVIKFIKHTDKRIVSQSCHTLLIFSQNCRNARIDIKKALISNKVIDLLLNNGINHSNSDEDVVKPLIGLMIALMPLTIEYKKVFLNANVLTIIHKFVKSCNCHKIYACELIKNICLKPICEQLKAPKDEIQKVIDSEAFLLINDLLQNDDSFDVKLSALDAIFVAAFMATPDQLSQLVQQGCLKTLCSQLQTIDDKILYRTLITITVFLFTEYKTILAKIKVFPTPKMSFTEYANIISKSDGINDLKQIIEKVKKNLKSGESQNIKSIAEDILIYAFGLEMRKTNEIMTKELFNIDCIACKLKPADTKLFPCSHVQHCHGCAIKVLLKTYGSDKPNECPEKKCKETLSKFDCPWIMAKSKIFNNYKSIEGKVLFEEYGLKRKA